MTDQEQSSQVLDTATENASEAASEPTPEATAPEAETGKSDDSQAPEQASEEPSSAPDTGTKFTEFKDPAEKARFDRVYRNMKENERALTEMGQFNRSLIDRLQKLEDTDGETRVQDLQRRQREAMETGDYDQAQQLGDEVLEVRLAERDRAAKPVPEPKIPSFEDNPVSDELMDGLAVWAGETDDRGQPLRPWARPDHPQHDRARQAIQSVVMDPDIDVKTHEGFQQMLSTIDQKMSGKPASPAARQTPAAAVLSGNSSGPGARGASSESQLSSEELRVADAMNLTPKQYADYKKQYSGAA